MVLALTDHFAIPEHIYIVNIVFVIFVINVMMNYCVAGSLVEEDEVLLVIVKLHPQTPGDLVDTWRKTTPSTRIHNMLNGNN